MASLYLMSSRFLGFSDFAINIARTQQPSILTKSVLIYRFLFVNKSIFVGGTRSFAKLAVNLNRLLSHQVDRTERVIVFWMPVSNSICLYWRKPIHSYTSEPETYAKRDTNSSPETNAQDQFSTNKKIARHRTLHLTVIYCLCHSLPWESVHNFVEITTLASKKNYFASVSGEPFKIF